MKITSRMDILSIPLYLRTMHDILAIKIDERSDVKRIAGEMTQQYIVERQPEGCVNAT